MDVIWSVLILNVQDIPHHLRTLLKAKQRPNLRQIHDHSFPRDVVNQVMEAVCYCAAEALPLWTTYIGLSHKHSDAHFTASILSAEKAAQDKQGRPALRRQRRRNMNVTHQMLYGRSASDMLGDYRRSCSCSCKPAAQPSSSSITASWPHGGAVRSYSKSRRLCNLMKANREWPY